MKEKDRIQMNPVFADLLLSCFFHLKCVTLDADYRLSISIVHGIDVDVGFKPAVLSFHPSPGFRSHINGIVWRIVKIQFLEIQIINIHTILQSGQLLICEPPYLSDFGAPIHASWQGYLRKEFLESQ